MVIGCDDVFDILLILFLLLLILNLIYQNKQLRLQRLFLQKYPDCRKNWMRKNLLSAKSNYK